MHQLDINLTPSLLGQYLDQQRIINKIVKPYINMSCELRFRNILMLFPSCRKRRSKGIVICGLASCKFGNVGNASDRDWPHGYDLRLSKKVYEWMLEVEQTISHPNSIRATSVIRCHTVVEKLSCCTNDTNSRQPAT